MITLTHLHPSNAWTDFGIYWQKVEPTPNSLMKIVREEGSHSCSGNKRCSLGQFTLTSKFSCAASGRQSSLAIFIWLENFIYSPNAFWSSTPQFKILLVLSTTECWSSAHFVQDTVSCMYNHLEIKWMLYYILWLKFYENIFVNSIIRQSSKFSQRNQQLCCMSKFHAWNDDSFLPTLKI